MFVESKYTIHVHVCYRGVISIFVWGKGFQVNVSFRLVAQNGYFVGIKSFKEANFFFFGGGWGYVKTIIGNLLIFNHTKFSLALVYLLSFKKI